MEDLAKLVAELAAVRGPAFYWYEREGVPAEKAFEIEYAERVHHGAGLYVDAILRVLSEVAALQ